MKDERVFRGTGQFENCVCGACLKPKPKLRSSHSRSRQIPRDFNRASGAVYAVDDDEIVGLRQDRKAHGAAQAGSGVVIGTSDPGK